MFNALHSVCYLIHPSPVTSGQTPDDEGGKERVSRRLWGMMGSLAVVITGPVSVTQVMLLSAWGSVLLQATTHPRLVELGYAARVGVSVCWCVCVCVCLQPVC